MSEVWADRNGERADRSPGDGAGPSVVAIGGGHGLTASLRAARSYAGEITAVVTVADDGGSSGRLRTDLGGLAMGDMRLCLAALADDDSLWRAISEHRFSGGDVAGHALGNLVLQAIASETGDWLTAVTMLGELVGARGRVLPATTQPVTVAAELDSTSSAERVVGQVAVATTAPVRRLELIPADPPALPAAVEAIAGADQVLLGPGSLFTSVLAAAIVPGIRDAVASSSARRIHVANLGEQRHETSGFSVADSVAALRDHGIPVDVVVHQPGTLKAGDLPGDLDVVEATVAAPGARVHDPDLLAQVLSTLP